MKRIQMKNSNERTIVVAFEEFIKNCKVRNLSPRTIKYYNDYMVQFTKFLNTNSGTKTRKQNKTLAQELAITKVGAVKKPLERTRSSILNSLVLFTSSL